MKKTKLLLALCLSSCLGFAQIIYTVAGNGTAGLTGNGGFATSAELHGPEGCAVDGSGNFYISDNTNHVIRKVTKTGVISTVAGNGTAGFSGDGAAATAAQLNGPSGVAVDASGNIYIADRDNQRIRKVTASTGFISTIAGNGTAGWVGDGSPATVYELNSPSDVAVYGSDIYIADDGNNMIRKISGTTISIVAGQYNGGVGGFSGDGAAATSAKLSSPYSVAVSGSDFYIGDNLNFVVRKVTASTGFISTYAGNHTQGFSGDGGAATSAKLDVDYGIAVDGSGNLLIADYTNNRVREVSGTCPAIAGPNQTNFSGCCGACPGFGVQIGEPSVPSMTYAWTCSVGTCYLSSTSIAQPTASPCNTVTPTVYSVTVSGTGCTTATSSLSITTTHYNGQSCCRFANPNSITGEPLPEFTNFAIFPNPSNNQVTITLTNTPEYIRIVDMAGKVAFETKNVTDAEFKVDVSKYSKGAYFIITKIGDTLEKQKLIVE